MTAGLLLDTCAVIWAANDQASPELRALLDTAWDMEQPVWVSPITAWEIGNLASLGRIGIARPALPWFEQALVKSAAKLADIDARVLVASTELPLGIHRDPADRIIIATARELGLRIVTRDKAILRYAEVGHVLAAPC